MHSIITSVDCRALRDLLWTRLEDGLVTIGGLLVFIATFRLTQ